MMKNSDKEISVYIHLPFCERKCLYCAFTSFVSNEDMQKEYIKHLLKEIENNALSCYSLEDDAVEFNPNRIKTLMINAEKTNYKSYDNIVSLTVLAISARKIV